MEGFTLTRKFKSQVVSLSFSADLRFLATAGLNEIKIWSTHGGLLEYEFKVPGWIDDVFFQEDGTIAQLSGSEVYFWHLDGTPHRKINLTEEHYLSIRVLGNGIVCGIGHDNGQTYVFDARSGFPVFHLSGIFAPGNLELYEESALILCRTSFGAKVWDIVSEAVVIDISATGVLLDCSLCPEKNLFASLDGDGLITMRTLTGDASQWILPRMDKDVSSLRFSRSGILICTSECGTIYKQDPCTGEIIGIVRISDEVHTMTSSGDRRLFGCILQGRVGIVKV